MMMFGSTGSLSTTNPGSRSPRQTRLSTPSEETSPPDSAEAQSLDEDLRSKVVFDVSGDAGLVLYIEKC